MSLLEPAQMGKDVWNPWSLLIGNIIDRLFWLFHAESRPTKSPQPHTSNRQFEMASNFNQLDREIPTFLYWQDVTGANFVLLAYLPQMHWTSSPSRPPLNFFFVLLLKYLYTPLIYAITSITHHLIWPESSSPHRDPWKKNMRLLWLL